MPKMYLVWNKAKNECVGFSDERDAKYTATGQRKWLEMPYMTPSLGDEFRELYGDEARKLPQSTVDA